MTRRDALLALLLAPFAALLPRTKREPTWILLPHRPGTIPDEIVWSAPDDAQGWQTPDTLYLAS